MYRDKIRLFSRRNYAILAVLIVAITLLSSFNGILAPSPATGTVSHEKSPMDSGTTYELLSFFETGLPTYGGTTQFPWTVSVVNTTFGVNTSASTSGNTLNFSLPIGNYTYEIGTIDNFTSSPSSATVYLNRAYVGVNVKFMATIYTLSFVESGLPYSVSNGGPQAPLWKVTISNSTTGLSTTSYSTTQTITFKVPNVNISYKITNVNGYAPTPSSGYVLISNGTYILNIQFSNSYSYLVFRENGLFSNTSQNKNAGSFGMHWSVAVTNTGTGITWTASSDSNTIKFWLPVGQYNYSASSIVGFSLSGGTGSVNLASSTSVNITYLATAVLSQTTTESYTLNLYEVGLQSGTSWSLAITNSTNSADSISVTSNSAIIMIQKPNGTYYVRVLDSGTMTPSPAQFELTVNGANVTFTVQFSTSLQTVTFTERDLNAGQMWGVIIMGIGNVSHEYTTTYRDLSVELANGSYFYRIVALSNYVYPLMNSSGFIVLPGDSHLNVTFTSYQYAVTFTESTLPSGATWNVLLNEPNGVVVKLTTSQTTLTTYLPNGTYLYVPSTSNSYRSSPLESTFHVGGSGGNTIALTFVSNLHAISFKEIGLPAGRFWDVLITSGSGGSQIYYSHTAYLNLSLLNGTYDYTIYNSTTYVPSPASGTLIVSGVAINQSVQFTRYGWNMTFVESGLKGTAWSVSVTAVNGTVYYANTTGQQISFNLTNGTYAYTIKSADNIWQTDNSSGSAQIQGSATTVDIYFTEVTYQIAFKMSGLNDGTVWGVLFDGKTYTSNTTYINLTLTNGTYNFVPKNITGYTVSPFNGTLHINGTGKISYVVFTKEYAPIAPTEKSTPYSMYIVVGVLVGLGAMGLGVILVLYYQRRKT